MPVGDSHTLMHVRRMMALQGPLCLSFGIADSIFMARPGEFLSFIIRINGEIVPTMPNNEEFSLQQIRDYVAGTPEVVGRTPEGYIVFQSKENHQHGYPPNEFAASMYCSVADRAGGLFGRIFLAHPGHIAPYWIRTIAS
jgi:hypothetical protein